MFLGDELDEIATAVIEDRDDCVADVGGRLGESDASLGQSVVLVFEVIDCELSWRVAVLDECVR